MKAGDRMIQLLSTTSENRSSYNSSNGKHHEKTACLNTSLFAQAIAATLQEAIHEQESDVVKEGLNQEANLFYDSSKKANEDLLAEERVMFINEGEHTLQHSERQETNTNQPTSSSYEQEEQNDLHNSVFGEESRLAINRNLDRSKKLDQGTMISRERYHSVEGQDIEGQPIRSSLQKEHLFRHETEESISLNKDGSEEKMEGNASLFLHTANESSHHSNKLSPLFNENRETENTYQQEQQELPYERQAFLKNSQDKAKIQAIVFEQETGDKQAPAHKQEMDAQQASVHKREMKDQQIPVHKQEVADKQLDEHLEGEGKPSIQKTNQLHLQPRSEQNQSQESSTFSSERLPDANYERGLPALNGETQKHGWVFELKEEGVDAPQEIRSTSFLGKQQESVDSLLARQLLRILRAAKTTYSNGRQQQIMLKLHPESLGRVNIQFIQQAQGYMVRISAERSYAKEAIERSLPQLRQLGALQDTKVEVLQIEDELPEENEHHSQQEQDRKGQQVEQLGKKSKTNFKEWMAAILQTEVKQDDAN